MNEITDIVFIFVFIYVITYFGIINLRGHQHIIIQKVYLFIAVFIFSSVLELLKFVRKKTPVKTWSIFGNALFIAMLSFIGLTIMYDMNYDENTRPAFDTVRSSMRPEFVPCVFIAITIALGKSIKYLFANDCCENTNYRYD